MFILFTVFLVFLLIGGTIVRCRNNEYLNPDWVDPHDWKGDRDPLQQLCPQTQKCEPCEHTAKSEYLRLVNSFFDENKFRVRVTSILLINDVDPNANEKLFQKINPSYLVNSFFELIELFPRNFSLTRQQIICIERCIFISLRSSWKN